jgi:hypothetical protein
MPVTEVKSPNNSNGRRPPVTPRTGETKRVNPSNPSGCSTPVSPSPKPIKPLGGD